MRYLVLVLILVAFQGKSQSYTVIHIIGKIYDTQSGAYLTKGTKVESDANLRFDSEGARAAVLSSTQGRFVIQQTQSAGSQSDIVYALTSVISPVRGRLSTRAGSINNTLDFQKHFNEGTIALLGKSYQVTVSPSVFPMSESQFFYAQYQYNNETINKKLGSDEDNLVIDLNTFFSIDGAAIDPSQVTNTKLYYYDVSKGSSKFITDMDITFVPNETLKSLAGEFEENAAESITEIINSIYGKCTTEQVEKAIAEL